ncbi:MAG TPA: YlxR family protein, partial [Candidatus Limnocylindrales bacterium]|nr:YlxR family protein [Candidatus Limnocylindrales bacterium]
PQPLRTCVVCRAVRPKRELVRIVRTSDGGVELDPTGRRAGRGAYVCPDRGCQAAPTLARALAHALERPIARERVEDLRGALTSTDEGGARGQE